MTEAGAVLGALGGAGLVLARSRAELLAGLAGLAGAIALLATGEGLISGVDADTPGLIAALAAGAVAVGALGAVMLRFPAAVLPLLLVTAPLRLPIEADAGNPLILGFAGTGGLGRFYPFYIALAGALVALVWRLLRGVRPAAIPGALALPLALLFALVAVSLTWSADRAAGVDQLVFFWLPFAALVAVTAHTPFGSNGPRLLAITVVVEAAVFAALGLWQAVTHELLFFTVALERANDIGSLFRVTSAFQDPNHYGRFVVLGLAVMLVGLWAGRLRAAAAAPLLAVLAVGLYFSYSQSSMVALAVVALAVAFVAGDRRVRRGVALVTVAAAIAGAGVGGAALIGGSADAVTSDRSTLVEDTGSVFLRHPLAGVGVGAQPRVTRDEAQPGTAVIQNASHTTPLTVAAELGVLGLAACAGIVIGCLKVLRELWRRQPPLALGLGAVLLALFVHSLFYGGLFENPIFFGALGVAAAAVTQRPRPPQSAAARTGKPFEALRS